MKQAAKDIERTNRKAPLRKHQAMFATESTIALVVTVSDEVDITSYGFSFAGAPVPWGDDSGNIYATPGVKQLLEWGMIGESDGSMKVTVTRDGVQVAQRPKSAIPTGETGGYDAMYILVN